MERMPIVSTISNVGDTYDSHAVYGCERREGLCSVAVAMFGIFCGWRHQFVLTIAEHSDALGLVIDDLPRFVIFRFVFVVGHRGIFLSATEK